MSNQKDPFSSIDSQALSNVSGGAARVASGGSSNVNDQLLQTLTQIGDSIKDLARNNSGQDQMTQMMMMMMMMGGFGGNSAQAQQPICAPRGGCGKKGW